jgi:hypothetical protein
MVKYHHYTKWEDWKNGMYKLECNNKDELIVKCISLLTSYDALYQAMDYVATNWTNAADQNMSDPSKNHQSWLGQAACCFEIGAPEWVTRLAWGSLTQEERSIANSVADKVYYEWRDDLLC